MSPRVVVLTSLVLATAPAFSFAQDHPVSVPASGTTLQSMVAPAGVSTALVDEPGSNAPVVINSQNDSGFLTGNQNFPNFIGFMSNPVQSIDPRAVTELWPIFGSATANGNGPLHARADMQVYGAGLYLALSDRFSVGLNQGGYAVLNVSDERERLLAKLGLPVPDRERHREREGWLNLGGFAQYTLIANVEKQCLVTAGMRWEAPSGATQVFQGGDSPTYLSPYITFGKEFGCWHVLGTTGYEFPADSGNPETKTFYANVHIDRKIGWFYPLVEFNSSFPTTSRDVSLTTHRGVLNLGTFTSSSDLVVMAVGADAVLIPGKLEFGAVYTRPISSQDHFEYDGFLVKLVYRF